MHRESERTISRRQALRQGLFVGGACFSGLFGDAMSLFAQSPARDLIILNAALYLEHEAIAAYIAGAGSGLLSADVVKVAGAFMSDHQYHRDGLAGVVRSLGQTPPEPHPHYRFGALRNANDVLRLALRLEDGAATAYRTLASSVQNKGALGFGANVMADEVRHRTVLRNVLKIKNY